MLRGYNVTLRRTITQEYECQIIIDDDVEDIQDAIDNVWDTVDGHVTSCLEEVDYEDDQDYDEMSDEEFNNKGDTRKEWYDACGEEIDIDDYIEEYMNN